MTRVKICGIRNLNEAMMAFNSGAWAIGEVFALSRRQIDVEQAAAINRELPAGAIKIGVFVNEALDSLQDIIKSCRLDMVQLHGDELPEYVDELNIPVIKSFRVNRPVDPFYVRRWRVQAYLFDTFTAGANGGSGIIFNWQWLKEVKHWPNIILAGGLNHANVGDAIKCVRPMAVDVSSGVEYPQGGKDSLAIDRFINKVREADTYVSL